VRGKCLSPSAEIDQKEARRYEENVPQAEHHRAGVAPVCHKASHERRRPTLQSVRRHPLVITARSEGRDRKFLKLRSLPSAVFRFCPRGIHRILTRWHSQDFSPSGRHLSQSRGLPGGAVRIQGVCCARWRTWAQLPVGKSPSALEICEPATLPTQRLHAWTVSPFRSICVVVSGNPLHIKELPAS
jgi:hypothetical protein